MKLDGEKLVIDAIVEHEPSKVFVLFSGGGDSSVLLSWAKIQFGHRIDGAVFIDTGTSIEPDPDDPSDTTPSVREFAEAFAENRGVPFIRLDAGNAYRRMCLKYGVPGPGAHKYAYVWLKERQIDRLIREHKTHRCDRILLLAGARRDESVRRMSTSEPLRRDGCQVWVNPLIDWTNQDMRAYRARYDMEQSPVAALLHRSGECNCGAYGEGEREMLRALFRRWFDRVIAPLEDECERRGLPCVWGKRWEKPVGDETGPLCNDCAPQLDLLEPYDAEEFRRFRESGVGRRIADIAQASAA